MKLRRTTVVLEDGLYRQVKQTAVLNDRSIRDVVQEALRLFCAGRLAVGRSVRRPRFGTHRLGIRGSLRRVDLYGERV